MSDKIYILGKYKTLFYDGHGCLDDGGSGIFVEHTAEYNDLDFSKVYDEDGEEFDEDHKYGAEDSYNCDITTYVYREISKEEYDEYKIVIDKYDHILNN